MSNYKCLVKIKKTGKIIEVSAFDDFFGRHKYAYVEDRKNKAFRVYREQDIEKIIF